MYLIKVKTARYIVERNGLLIASSTSEAPFITVNKPQSALETLIVKG